MQDLYFKTLTVGEHLRFQARLRLPALSLEQVCSLPIEYLCSGTHTSPVSCVCGSVLFCCAARGARRFGHARARTAQGLGSFAAPFSLLLGVADASCPLQVEHTRIGEVGQGGISGGEVTPKLCRLLSARCRADPTLIAAASPDLRQRDLDGSQPALLRRTHLGP